MFVNVVINAEMIDVSVSEQLTVRELGEIVKQKLNLDNVTIVFSHKNINLCDSAHLFDFFLFKEWRNGEKIFANIIPNNESQIFDEESAKKCIEDANKEILDKEAEESRKNMHFVPKPPKPHLVEPEHKFVRYLIRYLHGSRQNQMNSPVLRRNGPSDADIYSFFHFDPEEDFPENYDVLKFKRGMEMIREGFLKCGNIKHFQTLFQSDYFEDICPKTESPLYPLMYGSDSNNGEKYESNEVYSHDIKSCIDDSQNDE